MSGETNPAHAERGHAPGEGIPKCWDPDRLLPLRDDGSVVIVSRRVAESTIFGPMAYSVAVWWT